MKGKLALLGGMAVGYVLGTRDGRERFEQIKGKAQSLWNDPTVQQKVSDAQGFAAEKAPEVQEKVVQTAKDTVGKVTNRGEGGDHAAPTSGSSSTGSSTGSSTSSGSGLGSSTGGTSTSTPGSHAGSGSTGSGSTGSSSTGSSSTGSRSAGGSSSAATSGSPASSRPSGQAG
ncbi:YtxH domain-containing protein [Mumia sp.]|uniref:YtxH domain-containing protein n=1 Tax=Mumia sp. TaxID=1965300 RepID=UPI002639611F|nr:YtxH domain-containing protein [Mumia sp.]MDD9349512.1 YtxH domain-containing protein [Mumia sp.]